MYELSSNSYYFLDGHLSFFFATSCRLFRKQCPKTDWKNAKHRCSRCSTISSSSSRFPQWLSFVMQIRFLKFSNSLLHSNVAVNLMTSILYRVLLSVELENFNVVKKVFIWIFELKTISFYQNDNNNNNNNWLYYWFFLWLIKKRKKRNYYVLCFASMFID